MNTITKLLEILPLLLSYWLSGFQQQISIFIGLLMMFLIFPNRLITWSPVQRLTHLLLGIFKKVFPIEYPFGFILLGLLNGLLPCGFVYLALVGASATSTPTEGALFMAFFGFGTAPLMFFVGILPKFLTLNFRQKINKYLPIYTLLLSIFFIVRGLNLDIPYLSPSFEKMPISQSVPMCHSIKKY